MKKDKGKKQKNDQPLLPAAQKELDQKVQRVGRLAHHIEAYEHVRLILKGIQIQTLRRISENIEVLEKLGFKSIEDYFEAEGMSRSTGFNLKKIAETFSDEELTLLHSMGFSQRGMLKLASLPPGQLPDMKNTEDPEELKAMLESVLTENNNIKDAAKKVVKDRDLIAQELKSIKSRLPNQHNMDWAWLSIDSISRHIAGIQSDMNYLLDSMDHRLVGNPELKSRIQGLYTTAQRMLIEVFDKVDKLTGYHPGREADGE